jgi:class I fructose-bisphosphate aldolase
LAAKNAEIDLSTPFLAAFGNGCVASNGARVYGRKGLLTEIVAGERGMKVTQRVKKILENYGSEPPGVKANIARMLSTGRLAGTGKMIILPVDQGFEHGPIRSFAPNPDGYDPVYHCQLAIDAGLNAYASVLGMIEAVADQFAGQIPFILKVNSSNTLYRSKEAPDQAVTASVDDAVRLGCAAIGYTIYPGSDKSLEMLEELRELTREAKAKGLATVVWSYPRGGNLSKAGETAVDVDCYAAHIAALMGANIIKVKLPSADLEQPDAKKVYEEQQIDISTQAARVRNIMQAAFNGKRIVVFSGGAKKGADAVYEDARDVVAGGGNGLIIGRNTFQRPRDEALDMLDRLINIFLGREEKNAVAKAAE